MVKESKEEGEEEMSLNFDKRMFLCANGHEYESKEPITTSYFEQVISPQLHNPNDRAKANDRCKICGAQIVNESDYKDGKIVAGAILDPKYREKIPKLKAQKAGVKTNVKSKGNSRKV